MASNFIKCLPGFALVLSVGFALSSCDQGSMGVDGGTPGAPAPVKVTGSVHSANSSHFGAPVLVDIWQYTIAFMPPDGAFVKQGEQVLGFDTQELVTVLRTKENSLNEKGKELQKQDILTRERVAELRLLVEEARAEVGKAALKADIPERLQANRDYREHQLVLEQAKLTLALREALVKKEEAVMTTEASILQREIAVLEAEIEELQGAIDAMTIRAPVDGVVIHALDQQGNKLAVGDNVWGGRRVIEFPDLSRLELLLEIPERDSTDIAMGLPVSFRLDAAPDRVFHGQITELASVVHTKSSTQPAKVFDATVALLDPDPDLMRPGMSVNAEIELLPEREPGP